MKAIPVETLQRLLKDEKKKLRERRDKDHADNRARHSAASEDSVSRVLVLEEILGGEQ
jgi:hypothetical protein